MLNVSSNIVSAGSAEDPIVRYAAHETPFGRFFVALCEQGVCAAAFLGTVSADDCATALSPSWPGSRWVMDEETGKDYVRRIGAGRDAASMPGPPLVLRGTPFQEEVWEALGATSWGEQLTYEELAQRIGKPAAVRAVAGAVAANPIAYFVPCHRVVRKDGGLGGYRWGIATKGMLLSWEAGEGRQATLL